MYGHSHNELDTPEIADKSLLSCDVGVDSWSYRPVSVDEIVSEMNWRVAQRNSTEYKCVVCGHTFMSINNQVVETFCCKCDSKQRMEIAAEMSKL